MSRRRNLSCEPPKIHIAVPATTESVADVFVDQVSTCLTSGYLDAHATPSITSMAPQQENSDPALSTNEAVFSRSNSATITPATNSQALVNGE